MKIWTSIGWNDQFNFEPRNGLQKQPSLVEEDEVNYMPICVKFDKMEEYKRLKLGFKDLPVEDKLNFLSA